MQYQTPARRAGGKKIRHACRLIRRTIASVPTTTLQRGIPRCDRPSVEPTQAAVINKAAASAHSPAEIIYRFLKRRKSSHSPLPLWPQQRNIVTHQKDRNGILPLYRVLDYVNDLSIRVISPVWASPETTTHYSILSSVMIWAWNLNDRRLGSLSNRIRSRLCRMDNVSGFGLPRHGNVPVIAPVPTYLSRHILQSPV